MAKQADKKAIARRYGIAGLSIHLDIHEASGIGFGLSHIDHIQTGNILTTVSIVALAVFAYNMSKTAG